jgi:hypothetical protein
VHVNRSAEALPFVRLDGRVMPNVGGRPLGSRSCRGNARRRWLAGRATGSGNGHQQATRPTCPCDHPRQRPRSTLLTGAACGPGSTSAAGGGGRLRAWLITAADHAGFIRAYPMR